MRRLYISERWMLTLLTAGTKGAQMQPDSIIYSHPCTADEDCGRTLRCTKLRAKRSCSDSGSTSGPRRVRFFSSARPATLTRLRFSSTPGSPFSSSRWYTHLWGWGGGAHRGRDGSGPGPGEQALGQAGVTRGNKGKGGRGHKGKEGVHRRETARAVSGVGGVRAAGSAALQAALSVFAQCRTRVGTLQGDRHAVEVIYGLGQRKASPGLCPA